MSTLSKEDMAPLTRITEQEEAQREARERIGTLREEKGDRELVEGKEPKEWTPESLEYIANSPSKEHGGFHDNAIRAAKDALAEIKRLNAALDAEREQNRKLQDEIHRLNTK